MLSQAQVGTYEQDGFLALPSLLDDETVQQLRSVTDEFVEKSRSVTTSNEIFDLEPGHTAERPLVRRLKDPELQHPVYDAVSRNQPLLDALERLIGPKIRLRATKLNLKMPGGTSPVEWHQDWAFGPNTNDDILTVGITLDEMSLENGCLKVIPGSHRGPILSHWENSQFVGSVSDPAFNPEPEAVAIELPPGGVSIHHVRALHGSAPNVSSIPRRLLLFTYAASDAWPLDGVKSMTSFDQRIVRGDPVVAPRLEAVPVAPWPRYDEEELGGSTSLFDFQSRKSAS